MGLRQRRRFEHEEKVAIVRRHLLEQLLVSDLYDEYGIQPTLFYRWHKQLFEIVSAAFERRKVLPASAHSTDRQAGREALQQERGVRRVDGVTDHGKRRTWGCLNGAWETQAIRDAIVDLSAAGRVARRSWSGSS